MGHPPLERLPVRADAGHKADALNLPLMVPNSQDPRRTAYTVSVDAASGVTTGISAADRHHTIQRLAKADASPDDFIRPGHVLPLRAVAGGVLHRPGHTEAASICADSLALSPSESSRKWSTTTAP